VASASMFLSPRWLSRLSALAFAVAGLAVALNPGKLPPSGQGAFGRPVKLLSLLAVLAVVVSMGPARSRRSR